jgi:preprotein translocase subunit SecG
MLYYLLSTVYVLVCLLLLVVVLLQQGKGGDIASAFGGGGSQTAFGARQGATVLTKASTVLGALFMVGALMLAIIGQRGPGSVVGGTGAPAPVQQAPVEAPASPTDAPQPPATPGGVQPQQP